VAVTHFALSSQRQLQATGLDTSSNQNIVQRYYDQSLSHLVITGDIKSIEPPASYTLDSREVLHTNLHALISLTIHANYPIDQFLLNEKALIELDMGDFDSISNFSKLGRFRSLQSLTYRATSPMDPRNPPSMPSTRLPHLVNLSILGDPSSAALALLEAPKLQTLMLNLNEHAYLHDYGPAPVFGLRNTVHIHALDVHHLYMTTKGFPNLILPQFSSAENMYITGACACGCWRTKDDKRRELGGASLITSSLPMP
jgi:hypothetical protein